MKCLVCGKELERGSARCSEPFCRFPVIKPIKGNKEELDKILELADDYRKKKLEKIRISMVVYFQKLSKMRFQTEKETIFLVNGGNLMSKKTHWYPELFAKTGQEKMKLTLEIESAGGEKREVTCEMKEPDIQGFLKIGVVLSEGLSCRLVAGNSESNIKSERIPLIK